MSFKIYRDLLGQVWFYRCLTRCIEMFLDKLGLIEVLEHVFRFFGVSLVLKMSTRCIEMFSDKLGLRDVLEDVSRCFGLSVI